MLEELSLTKSGNFEINQYTGDIEVISDNDSIVQLIYITMTEMPHDYIIGGKYNSIEELEERLKRYLSSIIGDVIPYPVDDILFAIYRSPSDESINVSLELPDIGDGISTVEMDYAGKPGNQPNLKYNFIPNLTGFSYSLKKIASSLIVKNPQTLTAILDNTYAGDGVIRVYDSGTLSDEKITRITFQTEDGIRKYSLLDYIDDDGDITIDTVHIIEGADIIVPQTIGGLTEPQLVVYEYGSPHIYIEKDIPTGTEIMFTCIKSSALTFSTNVSVLEDTFGNYTFPLKPVRSKMVARFSAPLDPGEYRIEYLARIYHDGSIF